MRYVVYDEPTKELCDDKERAISYCIWYSSMSSKCPRTCAYAERLKRGSDTLEKKVEKKDLNS